MSDTLRSAVLIVIAALVGSVVGILVFIQATGGSGAPSGETVAPTLDANAIPTLSVSQSFALATRAAELEDTVAAQAAAIAALETAATAVALLEPTPVPTEILATEGVNQRVLYRIAAGGASEARFFLREDLRGARTDVIGRTDQVAGDIVIDFGAPALSQVGVIRVNARTLATDQTQRNRALRSRILRSAEDAYEFIEFAPTELRGLPDAITAGQTYPLEIAGQLTIVGQPLPVVFQGEVALAGEDRLRGEFSAQVRYADWGIAIPRIPFVANVDEEVALTLAFVAERVAE